MLIQSQENENMFYVFGNEEKSNRVSESVPCAKEKLSKYAGYAAKKLSHYAKDVVFAAAHTIEGLLKLREDSFTHL